MPATLEQVKQVIQEAFPGAEVDRIQETNHRIFGEIIWDQFQGQDDVTRNRLVTQRVRDRLVVLQGRIFG
jgi:acid stress-induced BolA-like protein IbaG/YrbA